MNTDEFRAAGHRMVELIADYFDRVEELPLFPDASPSFLKALFDEPLPAAPLPVEDLLDELEEKLLPYTTHVNHPGYFGLITPTPTPVGVLGDFLASALNQNVATFTIGPAAVAMERQTVRWLNDLIGFDEHAGGHLTSGGTMANFVGLKLARDWATDNRAQHEGLREKWAVYVSEERHVSLDKAVDAVGVGRSALRVLPTDASFSLRLDALEAALRDDERSGVRPMCIIGLAGTTNTGSVDALPDLRRIADRVGAWLHVDAAYGGGMLLVPEYADRLDGLALADSVTMDPHKWFYAPLDAGAVLVRDAAQLTRSFGMQPAYLRDEMDLENERYQYYVHSFEQSRRFRGLKVWMSFKRYGTDELGRWVAANVAQARHLYQRVAHSDVFEAAVRPLMSAICIRYALPGIEEATLSALHRDVARRIEEGGRFWISTTVLKGKTWFRINPVNFRTRLEHMDALFEALQEACEGAHRGLTASRSGAAGA